MKAVLLGAGLGTRLGRLAGDNPKILAPLGNEPLLARQLAYLAGEGCTTVLLNVHHRAEQVLAFLAGFDSPVEVIVSREPELLGTAGALLPMREHLEEPFILQYGDVVTDTRLADLLDRHLQLGGLATLGYYDSIDTREKGLIELDDEFRISGFVEKPDDYPGVGHVNAGLYALEPEILSFIPPAGDFGFDVWPAVAAAGRPIYGYKLEGYLRDIGSVEALQQANDDLAQGALAW
jgi:NDP-sugar pyrophosphorylase family protein